LVLLIGGLTGHDATGAALFDDTVWSWDRTGWTPAEVANPPTCCTAGSIAWSPSVTGACS